MGVFTTAAILAVGALAGWYYGSSSKPDPPPPQMYYEPREIHHYYPPPPPPRQELLVQSRSLVIDPAEPQQIHINDAASGNFPVVTFPPTPSFHFPSEGSPPEGGEEQATTPNSEEQPDDAETTPIPTLRSRNSETTGREDASGRYELRVLALPWVEAATACWEAGAQLAVPRSREDAEALGRLLASAAQRIHGALSLDLMHVGAHALGPDQRWRTVDGEYLSVSGHNQWLDSSAEVGESGDAVRECAAMLPDGHYIASPCGASLAFACEERRAPPSAQGGAGGGYRALGATGRFRLHGGGGTQGAPWATARGICRAEGSRLAVPASSREAGVLAGAFLLAQGVDAAFVGINDLAREGRWRTVLGTTLETAGFDAWAPGEPSGGRVENCAALQSDGALADVPCSRPLPFLCKARAAAAATENVEGDGDGYEDNPELASRYRFHGAGATWTEALAACYRENATLAAPGSMAESQFLVDTARKHTDGLPFFVSIHDIDGDGVWSSANRETLEDEVLNDLPPPQPEGRCTILTEDEFIAEACGVKYPFICKKPSFQSVTAGWTIPEDPTTTTTEIIEDFVENPAELPY